MGSRKFWFAAIPVLSMAIGIHIVYWQDPWLLRNYVTMMTSGSPTEEERLRPDEAVQGDGSFILPVALPEDRTLSIDALSAMRRYAAEFGSHALIVIHRGIVQDEWYAPHWRRDRLTQSQSMHKSLMGLLIGIAIDEGRIDSTSDRIGRYLVEWRDDPRGDITIEQLLTMSSGLAQYGFSLNPFNEGLRWLNSGRSTEAILATPFADWAPGSRYDYNNINSELLGMILVRVYGRSYARLLEEKLWRPLGNERAFVHTDAPGGRAFTSCCLAAPAMDWARIGLLLLGRGEANGRRIVSAEWISRMVTRSPTSPRYGYQIWLGYEDPLLPASGGGSTGAIAREPFLARDTYMTWGRGQQHVFVVPSRELVIVRLGPALGPSPIQPGFDVSFFVNTALRGINASPASAAQSPPVRP